MRFSDRPQSGEIKLLLAADVTPSREIRVNARIKNPTDHLIQLNITDRNPPVDLTIWDEHGNDLYQYAYANRSKDGKSADAARRHKNITLDLEGSQTKDYSWTVSKVFVNGRLVSIPPGHYKLQARLATVTYSNGRSNANLHQSNEVDLIVP
jgi:hypothetical protein